jgi:hypothetical protein
VECRSAELFVVRNKEWNLTANPHYLFPRSNPRKYVLTVELAQNFKGVIRVPSQSGITELIAAPLHFESEIAHLLDLHVALIFLDIQNLLQLYLWLDEELDENTFWERVDG